MKTAFFLRSSSDGQASIYIRITEGRGDQFKFATGHAVLHPDHWNKTKQRVRNKVEAVGCDEVNVQLEKLQAFVRQAHLDAKTKGQRRDRDFYLQVIQDFKRGVERSSVGQTLTIGEAFERFIDHASKHNSPITGSRLSKGTLENYAVTLRQIRHVLMDVTALDEVDMDWYHDFVSKSEQSGLNGKPLSKNYIGRHIKGPPKRCVSAPFGRCGSVETQWACVVSVFNAAWVAAELDGVTSSGVNRPLVPVAVLVFRRTGSRQSWVVSTFRSRSRSRSRAVLE